MATNRTLAQKPDGIRSRKPETVKPATAGTTPRQVSVAEAAARYRAILKALPDLMFVLSLDGTYVDFWADHEEELALPASQIIGGNIADLPLSGDTLKRVQECFRRTARTGKREIVEYQIETLSGPGYFEAHIVRLDSDHILTVARNITHLRENEARLLQTSQNLEIEKDALREKNIALEEVLRHLEQRAKDYQARVTQELERQIRPVLKSIRKHVPKAVDEELARLEERIEAILARDVDVFGSRYAALSQRELEVCDMLRQGLSSKQISVKLNLSVATVHKHREQIRHKLGFQGKAVNLAAYLRLHPAAG